MAVLKRTFMLIIFAMPLIACSKHTEHTHNTVALQDLEARIQKTEDVQAIKNLQAQYSYLIDTLQMEALVDLFADEFVWEGGSATTKTVVSTKPALLTLLNQAGAATTMMRHQATTPYIELNGDSAKGTWYVLGMLTAKTPDGEVAKWVQGRLNNEYVRENGEWKISKKSTEYNFSTPYEDSWVKTKNSGSSALFDESSDPK